MKYTYFLLFIVLIAGCKKDPGGVAYYAFEDTDINRLLNYTPNQILTFKNDLGEERNFRVSRVTDKFKNQEVEGMGIFNTYAASYFYYDSKEIYFEKYPVTNASFSISFTRFPIDVKLAKTNITQKYPSEFRAFITAFPYWNGNTSSSYSSVPINYGSIKSDILLDGKLYKNLFSFKSDNPSPVKFDHETHTHDVNLIYFDERMGLVGFKDLNNQTWVIQP